MPNANPIPRYRPRPSRRELLTPSTPLERPSAGAFRPARERVPLAYPGLAVVALNRMGFGPRPGDIAAFNALGADDDARLAAYVAQQLNPDPVAANDTEYHQRRNGLNGYPNPGFTTLGKSLTQLWQDHQTGGNQRGRPVEETRLNTYLRMVYSRWQLREVLADFWLNHFNIYGFEMYTQETFVHYDRDVIRPSIFGNFRTMLEAVTRSTSMLYYLDNYTNTRNGPNENWARELFELMTLGAENYYGVGSQAVVPEWGPGVRLAGRHGERRRADSRRLRRQRRLRDGAGVHRLGRIEHARDLPLFGGQSRQLPEGRAVARPGQYPAEPGRREGRRGRPRPCSPRTPAPGVTWRASSAAG